MELLPKKSSACIRTKQDEWGKWFAWTEGLPLAVTVQGQQTEGRAQADLVAAVRKTVEQLQAFLRFPAVNPPEEKEAAK